LGGSTVFQTSSPQEDWHGTFAPLYTDTTMARWADLPRQAVYANLGV